MGESIWSIEVSQLWPELLICEKVLDEEGE